jgi:hypothetical protein
MSAQLDLLANTNESDSAGYEDGLLDYLVDVEKFSREHAIRIIKEEM